jgi:hypothetical protein
MESVPRPLLCNRSVNMLEAVFSMRGRCGGYITRFHTEQISENVFKCLSGSERVLGGRQPREVR